MNRYTELYNPKNTPQTEVIPGREEDMTSNSTGGVSFKLDEWSRLNRFLILGSDTPTYYAGARQLTKENASNIVKLIKEDGPRVIETVVDVSTNGRAYKNDPALFVLALAFAEGDNFTKRLAAVALPKVARIGTHLFTFVDMVNSLRGWGSGLKKAVANWYTEKDAQFLAYQVTKYAQRGGWSHRDVLRKAHPSTDSPSVNEVFRYATEGGVGNNTLAYLAAVEETKKTTDSKKVANLIREYNLPREVVPTELLKTHEVWDALLTPGDGRFMPMTAMVRNLGAMTANGFLKPMSSQARTVVDRLLDQEALRKARVHPIQILAALLTYRQGHGARGSLSWVPVSEVVDALDEAFYLSFGNVEPTSKRRLMGIDVSGSMTWGDIAGVPGLTPNIAAAAIAMVSARTERQYKIMGFSHNFVELGVTARQRLDDAMRATQMNSFGRTDCSLPMKYALQYGLEVDSFEVYTDNETYAGRPHPSQALEQYRKETGIPATLSVVGMISNGFTIADPKDAGMMDFVGFDTNTPSVMSDFISDKL